MGSLNSYALIRKWFGVVALFGVCAVVSAKEQRETELMSATTVCPRACYCNPARYLVDCGYRSLVKPPVSVPPSVRVLNLAGNRIRRISAAHLLGLADLVELDLADNFIIELPAGLFNGTLQLKTLSLSGNRLVRIPVAALAPLQNLQQLYLARNSITALNVNDFAKLGSVTVLDLSSNHITFVSQQFLHHLTNLVDLRLGGNRLKSAELQAWELRSPGLVQLDLSGNSIKHLNFGTVVLPGLEAVNLTGNRLTTIESSWFVAMPALKVFELSDNPTASIASGSFMHATNLTVLVLRRLHYLTAITSDSFSGLSLLQELDLSENENLLEIDPLAFKPLHQLTTLDLSNNALVTLSPEIISNLTRLKTVRLHGNRWSCDCRLRWIHDTFADSGIGRDMVCVEPPALRNAQLVSIHRSDFPCYPPVIDKDHAVKVVSVHLGGTVRLDCPVTGSPPPVLTWQLNEDQLIANGTLHINRHENRLTDGEIVNSGDTSIVKKSSVNGEIATSQHGELVENDHVTLLGNGSLLLRDVTRRDPGWYRCTATNIHGNDAALVDLRLNYQVMSTVMLYSLVVGGASAVAFFSIAVILGVVRYLAHACSTEERTKRRSLRELVSQMRNSSQLDRLSAYRTAKMDQLSAFKSATMDQLSSFTSDRIGRLRKYKQATVTAVLHQLERMREYYTAQTARIKESYTMHAERLRDSYALQRSRFRDRRSASMQRVREQYRARAARAQQYSVAQVMRLREQYKQQQQYLLKLLELIDVGSCVSSAVEEECVRTESAIFDASVMSFDEEAQTSCATCSPKPGLLTSNSLPQGFTASSLTDVNSSVTETSASGLRLRSLSTSDVDAGNVAPPVDRLVNVPLNTSLTWKKCTSSPAVHVVQITSRRASLNVSAV